MNRDRNTAQSLKFLHWFWIFYSGRQWTHMNYNNQQPAQQGQQLVSKSCQFCLCHCVTDHPVCFIFKVVLTGQGTWTSSCPSIVTACQHAALSRVLKYLIGNGTLYLICFNKHSLVWHSIDFPAIVIFKRASLEGPFQSAPPPLFGKSSFFPFSTHRFLLKKTAHCFVVVVVVVVFYH